MKTSHLVSASRFSNFDDIKKFCAGFTFMDFNDPKRVEAYAEAFHIRAVCRQLEHDAVPEKYPSLLRSVSLNEPKPLGPNYDDLCRLHWLCLTRKVINVLEFGSGYSTVVLADAQRILQGFFGDWVAANIRVEKPFHVFSVEEDQRFLDITRQRVGEEYAPFVSLSRSGVEMILFDGRIATVYSTLPNISPDFIYLDGPSQYATTEEMNGFSIASSARMPMAADILRCEFFLEPGTLILTDGRTANARFLKAYMKRNWAYFHDSVGDVHYFELQEEPLGRFNRKKIEFCLGNAWLLDKAR